MNQKNGNNTATSSRKDKIQRELEVAGIPVSEIAIAGVASEMEADATISYEQAVKRYASKSLESMIKPSNPHDLSAVWEAQDEEGIKINRIRDLSISLSHLPIEVAELLLCASQANQIRPEVIVSQLLADALTGDGTATKLIKVQSINQKHTALLIEQKRIQELKRQKQYEANLLEIEALRISESMSNGMRPA